MYQTKLSNMLWYLSYLYSALLTFVYSFFIKNSTVNRLCELNSVTPNLCFLFNLRHCFRNGHVIKENRVWVWVSLKLLMYKWL